MRISDWSSDVCSSDLPEPVIDGAVLTRQLAETFARGEQAKVPVLAGFNEGEIRSLPFLMPKAPESQAAYVADVRRRFGAHADAYLKVYPGADPKADVMASIRDGLYGWAAQYVVRQQAATGRSEENTSEIQSIMRNS